MRGDPDAGTSRPGLTLVASHQTIAFGEGFLRGAGNPGTPVEPGLHTGHGSASEIVP